jgi:hypothetical protein
MTTLTCTAIDHAPGRGIAPGPSAASVKQVGGHRLRGQQAE